MTWILPKQLHTLASALDTEALSLDSNEQSQVCAQSLFVRSKPSQLRIWSAKWKRDSWTRHLSGRILRPSLGQRFATEWTSSLGDTHASPSVQPASAKVSKTRGIFGRLLQMAFDFSDPAAASLKTSKDISAWGCPTSSKTWQEWVIEQRGAYSRRLNAVRLTRESGSSSWPTSSARDWKGCYTTLQRKDGKMRGDLLPDAVNLEEKHGPPVPTNWPTPNCMDVITPNRDLTQMESKGHWGKNMNTGKLSEMVNYGPPVPASSSTDGSRPGLSEVATRDGNWTTPAATDTGRTTQYQQGGKALSMQVWQTATVSTGAHRQKDGSMIDKLDQQVKSGATPRAGKTTDENPETWALRQAKGDVSTMPLTAQVKNHTSGKLNPRWVETLMGLPVGWTMPSCASPVTIERMSSDCLGMESCRQQQNERSEC